MISAESNNIPLRICDEGSVIIGLEVERHAIVFYHALLEGYDGLAVVKTVDETRGIIALITTVSMKDVLTEFLLNLGHELPWRIWEGEIDVEELFRYREV